jgi:hypothetical protein
MAGGSSPSDEEAHVAHALEVGTDGVGVEVERLGDVGGGQRAGGARQLEVDRIARVVAERLEQVEAGRGIGATLHEASLHGDLR